ncbi:MAG: D-alanine--D-alanine ligase, partial [Verrucomicrobiales bacterium]
LELNTIPGMTESSLLPKGALAAGVDFTELCVHIAEMSLATQR